MERLLSRVEIDGAGCWNFTGRLTFGYGQFKIDGKNRKAHRVAYEHLVGPVPNGLCLDHLCRNRACCNPDHLEPVTIQENTLRGQTLQARNASAIACIHGHPFDETNTIIRTNGNRACRACSLATKARYRTRQREAS